ncbi:tetratricopeptide repeat protein [bacterium]|nr:tetratricopeptide repeat protein [bacterium]
MSQTAGGGTESPFAYGLHARTLGMGNAAVAYPQGSGAMYWNPGGMSIVQQKSAGLSLTTLFEGINYNYAGYIHPTLNSGVFGFGFSIIGCDGVMMREWEQNIVHEYGAMGYWWGRMTIAYSLTLFRGFSAGLSFDANRKVLGEWSANGFGLNGGIHYAFPHESGLLHGLFLGLSVENFISPRLRMGTAQEILPYLLRFGLAKRFGSDEGSNFFVLADLEKSEYRTMRYHLGAEFSIGRLVFLRSGINSGFITFGAGLRYRNMQLDYGTGPLGDLDLLPWGHRFSLQFFLGKSLPQMREEIEQARREDIQRRLTERLEAERTQRIESGLRAARAYLDSTDYFNSRIELVQVLREDPENQAARQLLELVETRENEYQEARRQQLLQEDRERTRREQDQRFIEEKRQEANTALAESDYRRAVIALDAALQRDPENAQLREYRTQAEVRLRQEISDQIARSKVLVQREAISDAYKALDIAAKQAQGDDDLTRRVARERAALDREVDFIHNYQEGTSRYEKKDYQGALPFLNKALLIKPDHLHVREMASIANSKVSGEEQPLTGRAKELYFRGINLFKNGKVKEALEVWEQALELAPNNGKILKTIHDVRSRYIEE